MTSEVFNLDCMEGMKDYPDKYFDLALVDPPYGIDRGKKFGGTNWKIYEKKDWDNSIPDKKYFAELQRVSVNQIIWGANYFTSHLPASMGWIFWDKGQDLTMSDGELAYTSFNKALRRIVLNRCHIRELGGLLHPTQKPVRLYDWIYEKYLPKGGKVIDTHLGSGSNRIAADKAGNIDFTGFELDKDYYEAQEKRFSEYKAQLKLLV
jgi:site-specific DNA-methyltransferase (adenine-specific)